MSINFRDTIPATPAQLRLIAILTLDLHVPEPRVDSFGDAGRLIQDLYAARRLKRNAISRPKTLHV